MRREAAITYASYANGDMTRLTTPRRQLALLRPSPRQPNAVHGLRSYGRGAEKGARSVSDETKTAAAVGSAAPEARGSERSLPGGPRLADIVASTHLAREGLVQKEEVDNASRRADYTTASTRYAVETRQTPRHCDVAKPAGWCAPSRPNPSTRTTYASLTSQKSRKRQENCSRRGSCSGRS